MKIEELLKDLDESKLHAFRFTWQGMEKKDESKRFVRIYTGSIDDILQFVEVLKKSCSNCLAEYLYSIDLEKSMCYYVVKEVKSEVKEDE